MTETLASVVSARCYCGAIAVRVQGVPQSIVNCHCGQCRRLSGAAFTTWVSFPKQAVQLVGSEPPVAFRATSNVTRHFCRVCGSHVFTSDVRFPEIVGVPAGIIEGQPAFMPRAHYFVSHKAAWYAINDALPQFGGESGVEPAAA